MTRRLLCCALALVMILSMLPVSVAAEDSGLGMRKLGDGEAYTDMTVSQAMVDMIKDMEGFRPEPYWDYSQWSIGYGSACGYDRNKKPDLVLTEPEAEALLRSDLDTKYGKTVNKFCSSIGRQPSQQQFDALLDFTYNLGGSWVSGCMLADWLKNPTTELDFVNAIGRWCRVSSKVTYSTSSRRIREAAVFLKGEYYLTHGDQDFETELELVSDHDLPYYKMIIFQANGGIFEKYSDDIAYYVLGQPYGKFLTPNREGYTFVGWQVIKENNKSVSQPYMLSADAVVQKNLTVSAVWVEGEVEETEPEVTEPEVTEPEETEPEVTEPEETEPEVTEPEETEPEVTEPEVTEPEVTEPEVTEPEVTEPEETEPTEPEDEKKPDLDVDVELPFRDVPKSAWFRESVEFVYGNGYMSGVSPTSFAPHQSVTRGMLVTVLYRIAGSPEVSSDSMNSFRDVKSSAYYAKAVAWAKENGIVAGISATMFGPDRQITRQDAVTILYRYYTSYLMLDGSFEGNLSRFADRRAVSSYAEVSVSWAASVGILSGSPSAAGQMINPKNTLTRAEISKLLYCLVELIYESV